MARVEQAQSTVARDRRLPLQPRLVKILERAAEEADLNVRVTSGGQQHLPNRVGQTIRGVRTGSSRHDIRPGHLGAADLDLHDPKTNRRLDFTNAADAARFAAFVEAAVAFGATGVGAAVNYMGKHRIHVGGGNPAVWGGRGGQPAPFLRPAHTRGMARQRTEKLGT